MTKNIIAVIAIILNLLFSAPIQSGRKEQVFYPGQVWLDSEEQPIEAHGGGILKAGGMYYWYGKNHRLGAGNKTGVSCYSSKDLYSWKNEGIVLPKGLLPAQYQDSGVCERPKVIYNPKTNRYVMWMHLDSDGYTTANAGVAVCDSPTGQFKFLGYSRPIKYDFGAPQDNPLRQKERGGTFRDMTLFVDDDGKGYVLYASEGNATMYISQLNDEFADVIKPAVKGETWERILVNQSREAPAIFKYGGKYYLITSGLTGWIQNPAQCATADSIFGPWKTLGNPCYGPGSETTFLSQGTFVLPAPGKKPGSFIFMADRWDGYDLSKSTFVWLPFVMRQGDGIRIENYEKWSMSIFDGEDKQLTAPKMKLTKERIKNEPMRYILKWGKVDGADAYRIFRNGQYAGVTVACEYGLAPELAGRAYNYAVAAITLKGDSSLASRPVTVQWEDAYDVCLSDIKPDYWSQGFGFLRKDKGIEGGPVRIVDKQFTKGLGTHSPSEIIYCTAGRYDRFTAWVGVDAYPSFTDASSVEFKVLGDGKLLFESGLMKVKTPAEKVDVSVAGVSEMKLVVTDAGDGTHYDHADWADAKLIVKK